MLAIFLARKIMNTLQHFLPWNPTLNPRQLYQYSQPYYELSVCQPSLKQHCEKYRFRWCHLYSQMKMMGDQRRCCLLLSLQPSLQNTIEQEPLTVLFYWEGKQCLACHLNGSIKSYSVVQKHTEFDKCNKGRPCKLLQTHSYIQTVFVEMSKRHLVGKRCLH